MPSEMLWLLLPLLWAGSLAHDSRYTLTVQSPVMVQEGLCVQVACKVVYPREGWNGSTPAHGYWFKGETHENKVLVATNNPSHKVQEETRGRFHLLGDPRTYNCSLDIRDARRTDEGSYFFRVERGGSAKYSYLEYKLSVHVTALNHTPDILIPGTLECGRPTNLTCSVPWACERGTPPIFSWTSAAHSSLGPRTRLSSVLTLTPRPRDHGANLTCQVHFPAVGVTVERTIQLNVTWRAWPSSPPSSSSSSSPSSSPSSSGVILGAFGGAGVTTLLFLAVCVIVIMVRSCRKKAARAAAGTGDAGTEGAGAARRPTPQGSLSESQPASRPEPLPPALAAPSPGKKEATQYASLRFHRVRPGSPQGQVGVPENEYSEIWT